MCTPVALGELMHRFNESLGLGIERGEVNIDSVEQGRVLLVFPGEKPVVERIRVVTTGEEVVVETLERDVSRHRRGWVEGR